MLADGTQVIQWSPNFFWLVVPWTYWATALHQGCNPIHCIGRWIYMEIRQLPWLVFVAPQRTQFSNHCSHLSTAPNVPFTRHWEALPSHTQPSLQIVTLQAVPPDFKALPYKREGCRGTIFNQVHSSQRPHPVLSPPLLHQDTISISNGIELFVQSTLYAEPYVILKTTPEGKTLVFARIIPTLQRRLRGLAYGPRWVQGRGKIQARQVPNSSIP